MSVERMTTGFDTEFVRRTNGFDPVRPARDPNSVCLRRLHSHGQSCGTLRCTDWRVGVAASPLNHLPCAHLPPRSPLACAGMNSAGWRPLPSSWCSARPRFVDTSMTYVTFGLIEVVARDQPPLAL